MRLLLIILICNKFRYIFNFATEGGANLIKSFSFHILIRLKSANGLAINSTLLAKLIGGKAFFFHCDP